MKRWEIAKNQQKIFGDTRQDTKLNQNPAKMLPRAAKSSPREAWKPTWGPKCAQHGTKIDPKATHKCSENRLPGPSWEQSEETNLLVCPFIVDFGAKMEAKIAFWMKIRRQTTCWFSSFLMAGSKQFSKILAKIDISYSREGELVKIYVFLRGALGHKTEKRYHQNYRFLVSKNWWK